MMYPMMPPPHFGLYPPPPPQFAPATPRPEPKPVAVPVKKPPALRLTTEEVQELNREFVKEKMDRPEVMFLY